MRVQSKGSGVLECGKRLGRLDHLRPNPLIGVHNVETTALEQVVWLEDIHAESQTEPTCRRLGTQHVPHIDLRQRLY